MGIPPRVGLGEARGFEPSGASGKVRDASSFYRCRDVDRGIGDHVRHGLDSARLGDVARRLRKRWCAPDGRSGCQCVTAGVDRHAARTRPFDDAARGGQSRSDSSVQNLIEGVALAKKAAVMRLFLYPQRSRCSICVALVAVVAGGGAGPKTLAALENSGKSPSRSRRNLVFATFEGFMVVIKGPETAILGEARIRRSAGMGIWPGERASARDCRQLC